VSWTKAEDSGSMLSLPWRCEQLNRDHCAGLVPDARRAGARRFLRASLDPRDGVGFRMVRNFFPSLPKTTHATTAALRP
jgi:hypothetical protein